MTVLSDVYAHSIPVFLSMPLAEWEQGLRLHHQRITSEQPAPSQVRAWANSHRVLHSALVSVTAERPETLAWTIAFEYELPRERGRRPDVVLLTTDRVVVLEFKDHPHPTPTEETAHTDQVAAYARDLSHYHAASHDRL